MADELQKALDLCNKNEFDKALPLLEEIVKTNPQESEAWRVLAQIHWNYMHEPDKAYDELNHSYRYVKGKNTKDSTINRNGLLNGSEPIIRIPGFLSLSQSVENLNISVSTETESGNSMIVTALTASMENSASLEQLIYNL